MNIISLGAILIYSFFPNSFIQKMSAPKFEDYPVEEKFGGKAVSLKMNSYLSKKYKTVLRENAQRDVDFGGHYILAIWGCGAACNSFAIIDKKTGNIYFPKSEAAIISSINQEGDSLQYQVNSRLLILFGAIKGEGKGKYYYVWKNNHLKLIRVVHYIGN